MDDIKIEVIASVRILPYNYCSDNFPFLLEGLKLPSLLLDSIQNDKETYLYYMIIPLCHKTMVAVSNSIESSDFIIEEMLERTQIEDYCIDVQMIGNKDSIKKYVIRTAEETKVKTYTIDNEMLLIKYYKRSR